MVEIFKTSVQDITQSEEMIEKLYSQFPDHMINFDLEDCDNILRVEYSVIENEKIIALLNLHGYHCEALL